MVLDLAQGDLTSLLDAPPHVLSTTDKLFPSDDLPDNILSDIEYQEKEGVSPTTLAFFLHLIYRFLNDEPKTAISKAIFIGNLTEAFTRRITGKDCQLSFRVVPSVEVNSLLKAAALPSRPAATHQRKAAPPPKQPQAPRSNAQKQRDADGTYCRGDGEKAPVTSGDDKENSTPDPDPASPRPRSRKRKLSNADSPLDNVNTPDDGSSEGGPRVSPPPPKKKPRRPSKPSPANTAAGPMSGMWDRIHDHFKGSPHYKPEAFHDWHQLMATDVFSPTGFQRAAAYINSQCNSRLARQEPSAPPSRPSSSGGDHDTLGRLGAAVEALHHSDLKASEVNFHHHKAQADFNDHYTAITNAIAEKDGPEYNQIIQHSEQNCPTSVGRGLQTVLWDMVLGWRFSPKDFNTPEKKEKAKKALKHERNGGLRLSVFQTRFGEGALVFLPERAPASFRRHPHNTFIAFLDALQAHIPHLADGFRVVMDAARGTVPRITTIDSSTPAPLSWVESVMARLVQDGSFHLITYSKSTVDTTADENMAIEQDVDHLDFPRLLITDALHHSNEPDT